MRRSTVHPSILLLAGVLAGCDSAAEPAGPAPLEAPQAPSAVTLRLDTLEAGLDQPLFVTSAPGDGRLFIVEQGGRILVRTQNGIRARPFLDLTGQVSTGSEQGLLGLAFHPDHATNGRFFVNYTNPAGDTRVVEYHVGANPHVADEATARLLLAVDQPASNHNGGMLAFGPDGYLYIAFGDGGGASHVNAQPLGSLLGKILRIDVDGALPYAVPPDNPYVGVSGARPEIWHSGLRNPWRFSFDRRTGWMYVADVGQNTYEEVDIVPPGAAGVNFGWSVMEGPACYQAATCASAGMRRPHHWYTHAAGCSITGGYVYRGRAMMELQGTYFFGDFCSGVISSFRRSRGGVTELRTWTADIGTLGNLTSFGEDSKGELYATTRSGLLVKFVPQI